ncbi:gluconate 2-dehydrogenase subunit 3 family protein [Sphingomonas qomolangmaensis]|uniref:Gluconate 2-dehydrogenase subunit 3 family protein n=1 Tax=Sphingomonas qomolangmaensis TaxID=2918765 RepID=A0ABY5L831_9SPHN|nr:gluconate 2-dehydrogenase subunit 3 family protein [Sphingomonas qomolangmaensis]UUL83139.1 gluconate 2-dehydrogenase subunit 3 family protein [Sphingomonas qomolangmaensis]
MTDHKLTDRRTLLKFAGLGMGAAAVPGTLGAQQTDPVAQTGANPVPPSGGHAGHAMAGRTPAPATDAAPAGYMFLDTEEAAFVEAFVDTLIPADELSAKGSELGVATFIDRQLYSAWGQGRTMYLQGPFVEGTPEQGYQSALTPADIVRLGIAEANAVVRNTYADNSFDTVTDAERVAIVTALEADKIALEVVPTPVFFRMLFQLAMDGFFADPLYGGNKGKASWKLLGYPGVGEMYSDKIAEWRNKPFRVEEPMSIQDFG